MFILLLKLNIVYYYFIIDYLDLFIILNQDYFLNYFQNYLKKNSKISQLRMSNYYFYNY